MPTTLPLAPLPAADARSSALAHAGGIDLSGAIQTAAGLGKEGVEVLERLHAIVKDERAAQARAALGAALSAFRAEMPAVLKTCKGGREPQRDGTRWKGLYAPLDSITAVLDPIAAKHGLSYRFDRERRDGADYITCIVTHSAGAEVSSRFPAAVDSGTGRNAIQSIASGETYAKRYALVAVFGITTADPDDDGEAAGRDPRADGTGCITDKQAANLAALISECPNPKEMDNVLRFGGCKTLAEFPAAKFRTVVAGLEQKRSAGA